MHDPECADIVAVGAGPTGSLLALLLADEGVRVIVAEKSEDVPPLPRAAHIDHEATRIFQALGPAEKVAHISRPVSRCDF